MGLRSPIIIIMLLPFVIMYNFKCAEAQHLTAENLGKTPIYVCTNTTAYPGPIKLDTNKPKLLPAAEGSSLILWGKLDRSDCLIDTQNPTAKTVAEFNFGNDSVSYSVSTEIGFNFGMRIRPLQGASACDTISCVGDLTKCPDELKTYENGTTAGCQTPADCSANDSARQLCLNFLSTSSCQTADGSPIRSTCSAASVEFVISFMSDWSFG